ncbi:DUF6933 domain-containing protein [Desemzia sp. FAM 23989]|uniref:DUF6933 domain-containing protein n=1 Tax=Desemzia sp. FAM 23989 TaxID=3259523 RepID=UPI0038860C61
MIIGVTKKTQPLFSALPTIEDKENGKRFAQVNPLFSWHANYINVNRKKILILLNDQTYTPLVLHKYSQNILNYYFLEKSKKNRMLTQRMTISRKFCLFS